MKTKGTRVWVAHCGRVPVLWSCADTKAGSRRLVNDTLSDPPPRMYPIRRATLVVDSAKPPRHPGNNTVKSRKRKGAA